MNKGFISFFKLNLIKDEQYLSGDEKKLSVISRLTEWISNTTGSVIIDDYFSFTNKMVGKTTLSETERLIQQQFNK